VATVTIGGLTASTSKTKTKDGAVAVDPTVTPAVAGTLSTRTNDTQGVISCTDTDVTSSDKAVLTWEDASGNLKHRYNVTCAVAEVSGSGSGTEYEGTISSGSGDDLPAEDYTVNIGLQVQVIRLGHEADRFSGPVVPDAHVVAIGRGANGFYRTTQQKGGWK